MLVFQHCPVEVPTAARSGLRVAGSARWQTSNSGCCRGTWVAEGNENTETSSFQPVMGQRKPKAGGLWACSPPLCLPSPGQGNVCVSGKGRRSSWDCHVRAEALQLWREQDGSGRKHTVAPTTGYTAHVSEDAVCRVLLRETCLPSLSRSGLLYSLAHVGITQDQSKIQDRLRKVFKGASTVTLL